MYLSDKMKSFIILLLYDKFLLSIISSSYIFAGNASCRAERQILVLSGLTCEKSSKFKAKDLKPWMLKVSKRRLKLGRTAGRMIGRYSGINLLLDRCCVVDSSCRTKRL